MCHIISIGIRIQDLMQVDSFVNFLNDASKENLALSTKCFRTHCFSGTIAKFDRHRVKSWQYLSIAKWCTCAGESCILENEKGVYTQCFNSNECFLNLLNQSLHNTLIVMHVSLSFWIHKRCIYNSLTIETNCKAQSLGANNCQNPKM